MDAWQELLRKLTTYKQVYGNCNVPHPWKEDPLLSQWVVNLRQAKARLPEPLLAALTALGFDFTPASGWMTYYGQLKIFREQRAHLVVPAKDKQYRELYEWIGQQRQVKSFLPREQIQLLDELGFDWALARPKEALWEQRYGELLTYQAQYGHLKVPSSYQENKPLAKWVNRQRENEQLMPRERKERLDQVGFLWQNDIQEEEKQAWLTRYEQLKAFVLQQGHFKVPSGKTSYQSLRPWMDKQRQFRERLSMEQEQMLSGIGFPWKEDIKQQSTDNYAKIVGQLVAFKQRFGHTRVPSRWAEDPALAAWVTRQRRRKDSLTQAQLAQLEGIGFAWTEDVGRLAGQKWRSLYQQLKAYQQAHGHCRVPDKYAENYTLGRWVSWQRKRQQENKLSPRRIALLDQLGFDWEVNRERENELRWQRMYGRLKRFFAKHGHSKVPENYEANKKLAIWVGMQRQYEGRLSPERKQKLEAVNFVFQSHLQKHRDETWEQMYDRLRQFRQQHGHCRVSITHPDGKLFRWVGKQRRTRAKLPVHRREKLQAIGFAWPEDSRKNREDKWQFFYEQLKDFKQRFGHCRVPDGWAENPPLANWVSHQRDKGQTLPEERKKLLGAVGFGWKEEVKEQKEAKWDEKYRQLEAFQQTHGHARVPANWAGNPSLGTWVSRQRQHYRQSKLPAHRQQQLDRLGFDWQVSKGPPAK